MVKPLEHRSSISKGKPRPGAAEGKRILLFLSRPRVNKSGKSLIGGAQGRNLFQVRREFCRQPPGKVKTRRLRHKDFGVCLP
jgi:hypothetical protein